MSNFLFQEKIAEYRRFFQDLWSDSKPLLKLFRTDQSGYVYDTGTNRIFACDEVLYELLDNLVVMDVGDALDKSSSLRSSNDFIKAMQNIRTAVKNKNVLKAKKTLHFGLSAHFTNLTEAVKSLGMIQLEITERCNLRCSYCLYNPHFIEKRNHGTRDMSLDVAFKAIDYLAQNSRHTDEVAVTFYGGEPLLRFPFIQECVRYAHSRMNNKNIRFSLTTNATLINLEMAKYFAHEEFGIHASIDGPEDIHDQHRKDINRMGSYQRTITGLKNLYEAYGNKKKISFSMVYAPPYSKERLDRISELWNELPWIPKEIFLNITYPVGYFPQEKTLIQWDSSLFEWTRIKFIEDYNNGKITNPIASNYINRNLAILAQRPIYDVPLDKYHLNGCCIPAARKIFVSIDGIFSVCERIGDAPQIGNVYDGIDIETIKDIYVKEYEQASLPSCSTCWALQLCKICYMHAFHKGKIDIRYKDYYCDSQKEMQVEFLKLFCSLIESNPSGLDYLSDWELR